MLGAIAGDLGEHFPPTEKRWQDADSRHFLSHALDLAAAKGLRPGNCDLTIIGERPRIAPHRVAMRTSLAELFGLR